MATTLLATAGLGREVDVQLIDATRGSAQLRPTETPNNRFAREVRNRTDEVETVERRAEIIQQQTVQRLTALRRASRTDTVRQVVRTAQGELSAGGLLVNRLA